MAFFRASAEITAGKIENVSFTSPTFVDMASVRIRNTGDPVVDTDATNRRFVEGYVTERIMMIETNLQGDNIPVTIDDRLFGAFHVTVMGRAEGRPIGSFLVSKSIRSNPGTIHTISSEKGVEGSRVDIIWPINSGILLSKIGTGDNGIYLVKLV